MLKKIPAGRDVDDGDAFRFNADFEDPRPKIHINSIQAKVSVRSVPSPGNKSYITHDALDSRKNQGALTLPSRATENTTLTPRLCG